MRGDRKLEPIKSNSAVYSIYSTAFRSKDQKAVLLHLLCRQLLEGSKPHIGNQPMQVKVIVI